MENLELTMWYCQFPFVHWTKLLVQTLCFCSKTQKHCGGVFVVSHKIAWPSSLLLYLVSFFILFLLALSLSPGPEWSCLLGFYSPGFPRYCPVLVDILHYFTWWCVFSFKFFFFGSLWLNFFFLSQLQVYVLSTSSKVNRTSVIECSGKLLLQPV